MVTKALPRNLIATAALAALLVGGAAMAQDPGQGLVPVVQITAPTGFSSTAAKMVPLNLTLTGTAVDSDDPSGYARRYRYLVNPAMDLSGNPIRTLAEYNLHYVEVLSLEDPGWSDWSDVDAATGSFEIHLADLLANTYYLVTIQLLDADGAVSDIYGYQQGTYNLRAVDGLFRPDVTLVEPFLGAASGSMMLSEIASGQPLNFQWTASADLYGGTIVSYRHGWDLIDFSDPYDPGWTVPPGTGASNLFAAQRSFQEGLHTFHLRVIDDAGQMRDMSWTLRVIPFVAPEFQLPLLVLDQTVDNASNSWPSQSGIPLNNEVYRNAWWHFLAEGAGGVAGLNWDRDWRNHTAQVRYADLVNYKAVLCYAQTSDQQTMFSEFRPFNDQDRFVWLAPYQQQGGNFFLVGGGSMESFLEALPNYAVPMIFESQEETYELNGQTFIAGFGDRMMPDGSLVARGPRMYPFATAGIAALDWTSPNTKYIYGRPYIVRFDRAVDCVGLKGLVLETAFRDRHLIGPGVVADTLWTEPTIDWQDAISPPGTINLFNLTFPFRNDEFIDGNISSRSTPIIPQECVEGPGALCVEPMYRGIARFDYVREQRRASGDTDWPSSQYTDYELDNGCGPLALTSYEGLPRRGARTNGQVFGYLSHKSVADKPSGKADVYWGFDPYRFDHTQAREAVRWVLDYFGLPINN